MRKLLSGNEAIAQGAVEAGALFAPDGDLDYFARRLCEAATRALRPGGLMLIELGFDQGARVLAGAHALGLEARLAPDLAGIPRVLVVQPCPDPAGADS